MSDQFAHETETPDNRESMAVADPPDETGWVRPPDDVLEGYGDPEQGKFLDFFEHIINGLRGGFQNVRVIAPVRSIEMAASEFNAFSSAVPQAGAAATSVQPARLVGRDPARKGVTMLNRGDQVIFFGPIAEQPGNLTGGELPPGVSLSIDTKAEIWFAAANGGALAPRITIVLLFE